MILKSLIKSLRRRFRNKPIINLYKREYSKRMLLCYITEPFKNESFSHTNYIESGYLANVFNDLGFIVDVVDYDWPFSQKNIINNKYDLIFGFGDSYNNAIFNQNNVKATKIMYATGAHNSFQNNAELNRIKYLHDRKGVILKPKRIINKAWSIYCNVSDAILLIGNGDFTKKTFEYYTDVPVYPINIPIFKNILLNNIERDYTKAKKHFLWFGSGGLVHKGLDLCLEAFFELEEFELHICGPKEDDFFDIYSKELFDKNNIHYHGFVDISSHQFKSLVSKCAFTIFPSCSEGMSGSLVTTMSTGLLPLATLESGVDINKKFGFLIDADIELIKKKIIEVSSIDNKLLLDKSKNLLSYIDNNFKEESFYNSVKSSINKIIKEKK